MQRLALLTLLLLALPYSSFAQTDTVPVFHHNYLVERHTDLLVFADEMVAYAQTHECPPALQENALRFQESVAAINVWESEDVVATMNQMNALLEHGTYLREDLVQQAEGPQFYRNAKRLFRSVVPYILAVIAFPLVFRLLFRRP